MFPTNCCREYPRGNFLFAVRSALRIFFVVVILLYIHDLNWCFFVSWAFTCPRFGAKFQTVFYIHCMYCATRGSNLLARCTSLSLETRLPPLYMERSRVFHFVSENMGLFSTPVNVVGTVAHQWMDLIIYIQHSRAQFVFEICLIPSQFVFNTGINIIDHGIHDVSVCRTFVFVSLHTLISLHIGGPMSICTIAVS